MFAKSLAALSLLVLSVSLPAFGHAVINPVIGITGAAVRGDVQRPSTASPCGTVNIATALKTSTSITATGDAFTAIVQNFNAGQDGSTEIKTATVDTTATGKSFKGAVTFTKNGVLAPTTVGSVQIAGTLPAGTKCTGGADKASCLVSFTTEGGFGNCVLISQGAAKGKRAIGGTRAPRALASGEESFELARRGVMSWIWA